MTSDVLHVWDCHAHYFSRKQLEKRAKEQGITTMIIHNTSILSAVPSHLGLSAYRFGRTATLPFPENKSFYPYDIVAGNPLWAITPA